MHKHLIFLSFCFFSSLLFSQYDNTIKSYIPPTPNAASFGKYTDFPVDGFTGSMNLNIPIDVLNHNQLSHSVALGYHTGGIRASEVASSVGLGWALQAGGMITRTVRGAPDESIRFGQLSAYYLHGVPTNFIDSNIVYLAQIFDGRRDVESDLYFYNFDGYSGSFVFDGQGNIIQYEATDLKIIPTLSNLTDQKNKFSWKIITPDGNIYHFGDTNPHDGWQDDAVTYTNSYTQDYEFNAGPPNASPIPESWHLVKIESHDSRSFIDFEYDKWEEDAYRNVGTSKLMYVDTDGRNAFLAENVSQPGNNSQNWQAVNPVLTTDVAAIRLSK